MYINHCPCSISGTFVQIHICHFDEQLQLDGTGTSCWWSVSRLIYLCILRNLEWWLECYRRQSQKRQLMSSDEDGSWSAGSRVVFEKKACRRFVRWWRPAPQRRQRQIDSSHHPYEIIECDITLNFLVAYYATLHNALSVRLSVRLFVRPSVYLSVHPSHFTFFVFLRFLASLHLPNWWNNIKYGPCPPARHWNSRVSGLVLKQSHGPFANWFFCLISQVSTLWVGTKWPMPCCRQGWISIHLHENQSPPRPELGFHGPSHAWD